MTNRVLLFDGVTKTFPGPDRQTVSALTNVSLALSRGEFVCVAGPDGAGKSTLAAIAAGLYAPEAGRVEVLGKAPDLRRPAFTQAVSYLPQTPGLYRDLTVAENLAFFAALKNMTPGDSDRQIPALLALTGLTAFTERAAGKLSGGMRQKLGLACALLGNPELLILDEPTVGVDPLSRREIQRIIVDRVKSQGLTCLMCTTLLSEAAGADRVLLINHGRTLAADTPAGLCRRAAGRTYALPRRSKAADHRVILSVRACDAKSPVLDAVPNGDAIALLTAPDAQRLPDGWVKRAPAMEDAYCALTLPAAGGTDPAQTGLPTDKAPLTPANGNALPMIEAQHISRRFGDFLAVADTSFAVQPGEIFGLLGPNGAGKTTTFRMLNGLLKPTGGRVLINGEDLASALSKWRSQIGYAAQKFSLYSLLTVEDNLRYFALSYGLAVDRARSRIEAVLTDFDLQRFRRVRAARLPLGAKRALTMAVALLHQPRILFLDEPTSGADTANRRAFWRRIIRLSQAGTTIVVTTHFMEEAEYCDRILIQDEGRVLAIGTPAAIRRAYGGPDGPALLIDEAFARVIAQHRFSGEAP